MGQEKIKSCQKIVLFSCEASPVRGAGHAVRCSALADALVEKGWRCAFVTSQETYNFIPSLSRFERIDPGKFLVKPIESHLFVVDNYDLDASYEKNFRAYAKKIMVIDDLANRPHDCDILLDQTYGRNAEDYRALVPQDCEILAGSTYALLRPEFAKMRPRALEKRRKTTKIKRILVSLGGGDSQNYTIKALQMIKESDFSGMIDIVLGFKAPHFETVQKYAQALPNDCTIYIDADMPQLMHEADLAIGAAGSTIWERACLGLPSVLIQVADNQSFCFSKISEICSTLTAENNNFNKLFASIERNYQDSVSKSINITDGQGAQRIINLLKGIY